MDTARTQPLSHTPPNRWSPCRVGQPLTQGSWHPWARPSPDIPAISCYAACGKLPHSVTSIQSQPCSVTWFSPCRYCHRYCQQHKCLHGKCKVQSSIASTKRQKKRSNIILIQCRTLLQENKEADNNQDVNSKLLPSGLMQKYSEPRYLTQLSPHS